MKSLPYLMRRGTRFYFRMRLPAPAVAMTGHCELKRSLFTADAAVARRRSSRLAILAFRVISRVGMIPMLSESEILAAVRDFYQCKLDADDVLRVHGLEDNPELQEEHLWGVENREADAAATLDDLKRSKFDRVEDFAAYWLDADSGQDFRQLCHALMRALVEVNKRAVERDAGIWDGEPTDRLVKAAMTATFQPLSLATWSNSPSVSDEPGSTAKSEGQPINESTPAHPSDDVALRHAKEMAHLTPLQYLKKSVLPQRKKLADDTKYKYIHALEEFEAIVGSRPITAYQDYHVNYFKDELLKAPKYSTTSLGLKSFKEGVEWNNEQSEENRRPTLDPSTINNDYLTYIRTTFRHAANAGVIERALGATIAVEISGSRQGRKKGGRQAFSINALNKMFGQPLFLGAKSENRLFQAGDHLCTSWKFWVPLCMLFMGIRPEELGQAEVRDIVWRAGHACLKVTNISEPDDDALDEELSGEVGKTVKSLAGFREIPLHPVLLDLGFMEIVVEAQKARERRIFPDWTKTKGRFSETTSKFFNRDDRDRKGFLIHAGLKSPKHVLYSLRHNFKQALQRNDIPEGEQDYLMGHANPKAARNYESREAQRALIARFKELEYDDLDLCPLFNARGRQKGQAGTDRAESKIVTLPSRI